MKKRILLLPFAIGMLWFLTGCPSPGLKCNDPYPKKLIPVQVTFEPARDSLRLGDTLFLKCSIPTKLLPPGESDSINVAQAKEVISALILRELILKDKSLLNASSNFVYLNLQGRIQVDPSKQEFENAWQPLIFRKAPGSYNLEIGLVTRRKGIYDVGIMSGSINGRQGKDDCGIPITISVANPDPHHYYLEEIRFSDPNAIPIPNIHYLFKVF